MKHVAAVLTLETEEIAAITAAGFTSGGVTTADNGLTATAGNVKLGGTLTADTVIAQAGNSLTISDTAFSRNWDFRFDTASGAYGELGLFMTDPAVNGEYAKTGVDTRGAWMYSGNGGAVTDRLFSAIGTYVPSYYSPAQVGRYQCWLYSAADGIYGTGWTELECVNQVGWYVGWRTVGDWRFESHLNSVNNLAASTPSNFLYTDSAGVLKSGALNSDITRTALGLSRADIIAMLQSKSINTFFA